MIVSLRILTWYGVRSDQAGSSLRIRFMGTGNLPVWSGLRRFTIPAQSSTIMAHDELPFFFVLFISLHVWVDVATRCGLPSDPHFTQS